MNKRIYILLLMLLTAVGQTFALDYFFSVAGKQITTSNLNDVLGDGGTVKFDPSTKTLTLTNAKINYTTTKSSDGVFVFGYDVDGNTNLDKVIVNPIIKLVGTNEVTSNAWIAFWQLCQFSGTGNLTVNMTAYNAIGFNGNVTVTSDLTGWVSMRCSGSTAKAFTSSDVTLKLPNTTNYFLATGSTPAVKINILTQSGRIYTASGLDGNKCVNFGYVSSVSTLAFASTSISLGQEVKAGTTCTDCNFASLVSGGKGTYYFTATGLPSGLTLDPITGKVTGTYTTSATSATSHSAKITVTDIMGQSASKTYSGKVYNAYGLYVKNVEVTDLNKADVLGDGHVSYTASTKTLYLNNATIDYTYTSGRNAVFYYAPNTAFGGTNLNVNLTGTNTVTSNAPYGFYYGATFSGSGNLTMNLTSSTARGIDDNSSLASGFTGYVSIKCPNGGDAMRSSYSLTIPNTTNYFVAKGTTAAVTPQTLTSTAVTSLNYQYVNFGYNLTFSSFSLPDMKKGTAITSVDCSSKVSGYTSPLTFSATGLPAGITINSSTGVISGTPTTLKNSVTTAQVKATDALGRSKTISVNVGRVYEMYNVYVAGTQVTSFNKDDVLADGGHVSYDPTNRVLTLDNATIDYTCPSDVSSSMLRSVFYDSTSGLKVNLIGKNVVTSDASYGFWHGLTFTGSGNLGMSLTNSNVTGFDYNVSLASDFTGYVAVGCLGGGKVFSSNYSLTIPNTTDYFVAASTSTTSTSIKPVDLTSITVSGLAQRFVSFGYNSMSVTNITTPVLRNGIAMASIDCKEYVTGANGAMKFTATELLPTGITVSTAGIISGTPTTSSASATTAQVKVVDNLGQSRTITVTVPSISDTYSYRVYYAADGTVASGLVNNWSLIRTRANTQTFIDNGSIMVVQSTADVHSLDNIPQNVIVKDATNDWYAPSVKLTDGKDYGNIADETSVDELTYVRDYEVSDKWQPLYVPFGINVADFSSRFDIAEIFAICPVKDTNDNGVIDADDDPVMIVSKLTSGTTSPNVPYVIRAKSAGTQTMQFNNATLYKAEAGTVTLSSSRTDFTITGVYLPETVDSYDNNYTVTTDGKMTWVDSDTTVNPYSWYMHAEPRTVGYGADGSSSAKAAVMTMSIFALDEDLDEETAVKAVNGKLTPADKVFSIGGMKVSNIDRQPAGIYIINGKKVNKK